MGKLRDAIRKRKAQKQVEPIQQPVVEQPVESPVQNEPVDVIRQEEPVQPTNTDLEAPAENVVESQPQATEAPVVAEETTPTYASNDAQETNAIPASKPKATFKKPTNVVEPQTTPIDIIRPDDPIIEEDNQTASNQPQVQPNAAPQKVQAQPVATEHAQEPVTPEEKKEYDDATFKALITAGASPEEQAEFLSRNPEMWKDLSRLYKEAEDELDPKKKAEREKKERLRRNMIAMINMIGALGNFAAAAGSKDGRSVPVANLVEAEDKRIAADKADRLARLDNYKKAQQKYGDYVSSIYSKIAARKNAEANRAASLAAAQMRASNGSTPATIEAREEYEINKSRKMKTEADRSEYEFKQLQTKDGKDDKMWQIKYDTAVQELKDKKDKARYNLPGYNGIPAFSIPTSVVNESTVGGAWNIIAKDKDLKEIIMKLIHPEKPNMFNDDGSMFNFDSKTFSQNEAQMKASIGIALMSDSKIVPELVSYLKSLDPETDPDLANPYAEEGADSNNGGADPDFDPEDPMGKKKRAKKKE